MGDLIQIKSSDDDPERENRPSIDERETLPARRSDYFIVFTFAAASALFIFLGVWKVMELVASYPLR